MLVKYLKGSARLQNLAINYKQNVEILAIRKYTTQAEIKCEKERDATAAVSLENARPYEEIPGPTKLQFIRGFLPGGKYYKKPTAYMIADFVSKYGTLFRMPGIFGNSEILASMNPDDYAIIFRNEGPWPNRMSFNTLTYHREVHRREVFQGIEGILATSGEKWYKVRTAVNPVLLQPKNAKLYLNTMLEVNNEFLLRIREIRDPVTHEMPDNFEEDINRLAFEFVTSVALNTQLGCIRKNRDDPKVKTLFNCLRQIFDLAFELEIMPSFWRIVKTPKFHKLMQVLDAQTDICIEYIDAALVKIEQENAGQLTLEPGKEKSVLEKLLRIDKRIAVAMALDMMMAGVDTTSTTLVGILFCIAKNPEKQKILLQEVMQVLPNKDSLLTIENMRNLPYLRACIKEGIRLYPIQPGTMRALPHEIVLSGFRIPKGINIAMGSNILLHDEKYVPNANKFQPERWLRHETQGGNNKIAGAISNPFMYVPFGFGPRSCAGKRIVDLELEMTVARLVRNFNIEFNYSIENAFKSKLQVLPAIPLKYKFEERNV